MKKGGSARSKVTHACQESHGRLCLGREDSFLGNKVNDTAEERPVEVELIIAQLCSVDEFLYVIREFLEKGAMMRIIGDHAATHLNCSCYDVLLACKSHLAFSSWSLSCIDDLAR